MVSIETINKIFDEILNTRNKCSPNTETIRRKLGQMSQDDIIDALQEGGWLNDSEEEVYSNLLDKWDKVKDKDYDSLPPRFRKAIDDLREQMFYFEKKIFTHEKTEIPDINDNDYLVDNQEENRDITTSVEQSMVDLQNTFFDNLDWDKHGVGTDYFGDAYWEVNASIHKGEDYWKEQRKEGATEESITREKGHVKDILNHLDYIIDNAPTLNDNVKLFRGGRIDLNIPVGGKGKFKSYTSTSYRSDVAEDFRQDNEYLITIYAPQGTKGVNGNARYMGSANDTIGWKREHEFLLGRGQEYIVLERNDRGSPPTASIVLV